MNEINISKTLITKRKEKGITQDELARHMGVSKASVSKWETGQSYPDITFLPQLATFFNISVDELIHYQPQMLDADIRKLYHRLAKEFSEKPFADVLNEIRETVKKYYSCFPLLFHMGALLINYQSMADGEERERIIREAMDCFLRIKTECNDAALCKQAIYMEALCHLLLSEPASVIDLLETNNRWSIDENSLLASGYAAIGDIGNAQKILQLGIYQNILNVVQDLSALLQLAASDPVKSNAIIIRIHAIIESFDLERLHPGFLLSAYLMIAQVYGIQNQTEDTLRMLRKYCDLAVSGTFPLMLHGDAFFDKLDSWLEENGIDLYPPRNDIDVKKSILEAVEKNPVFAALASNKQYQQIIQALSTNL